MPYFISNNYNGPSLDDDDYWNDQWGLATDQLIKPLYNCELVDEKYFPNNGYLLTSTENIPALFSSQFFYCNEAIKNALEELEPSRHRFHPYNLREHKDGGEITRLYIINMLDRLDAIDEERSKNLRRSKRDPNSSWFQISFPYLSEDGGDLVLKEDLCKGRHFWRGMGVTGPGKAFVSDEFYEIILRENFPTSPFDFYKTE